MSQFTSKPVTFTHNIVDDDSGQINTQTKTYEFKIRDHKVKDRRIGVLVVGVLGNNGSTFVSLIDTCTKPLDWLGSMSQCGTVKVGYSGKTGESVYKPIHEVIDLVEPKNIVCGGWDIRSGSLGQALAENNVLTPDQIERVSDATKNLKALPAIYKPNFIASNQNKYATNVLDKDLSDEDCLKHISQDITKFCYDNKLEDIIIVWAGSTERMVPVNTFIKDDFLENSMAPSRLYALAAIQHPLCNTFVNTSPQNTISPEMIRLAEQSHTAISGDDLSSGQTKAKKLLVEYFNSAGIRVKAIASYNSLGSRDGENLQGQEQLNSKIISKTGVVEQIASTNRILYPEGREIHHAVTIQYLQSHGDLKRAHDNYSCELNFGAELEMTINARCPDTHLAIPMILDLVLFSDYMSRVSYVDLADVETERWVGPVLPLELFAKSALPRHGHTVENSYSKQHRLLTNLLLATIGLVPDTDVSPCL